MNLKALESCSVADLLLYITTVWHCAKYFSVFLQLEKTGQIEQTPQDVILLKSCTVSYTLTFTSHTLRQQFFGNSHYFWRKTWMWTGLVTMNVLCGAIFTWHDMWLWCHVIPLPSQLSSCVCPFSICFKALLNCLIEAYRFISPGFSGCVATVLTLLDKVSV